MLIHFEDIAGDRENHLKVGAEHEQMGTVVDPVQQLDFQCAVAQVVSCVSEP
ncbi:hypothetical protein ACIQXD_34625 [Streptomyces uncialis]|uniref:hypothetical protein n=1 Tax=Streptomyces uncialis TaxID=1048205 RepID=UPI0037F975BE